jgi:hypothetical protein
MFYSGFSLHPGWVPDFCTSCYESFGWETTEGLSFGIPQGFSSGIGVFG